MEGSTGWDAGFKSQALHELTKMIQKSCVGFDDHKQEVFDLKEMGGCLDGFKAFEVARRVTPNVAYFVPRNTNLDQVASLAGPAAGSRWSRTCSTGR